ncbi:MAG: hypothetical protein JO092_08305 [Candidatus Eremiobacteraeota bacterium]|nr:hypothetical protein [Candidatus Eremiobacteraeota bacterium]
MRIAAFENEPEAAATANMLKERGYDSKVVVREEKAYEGTLKEFFEGKPRTYEPHAFVISENAEFEPFMRAANRHYGFVIQGETE